MPREAGGGEGGSFQVTARVGSRLSYRVCSASSGAPDECQSQVSEGVSVSWTDTPVPWTAGCFLQASHLAMLGQC